MTNIITPDLVRRYLRATGWTQDPTGEFWDRAEPLDGNTWFYADDVQRCLDGETVAHLDRAVLGMLAAAEMLYARAAKLESSTSIDGSYKAAVKRREDKREGFLLRNEAERLVEAAGVDPKAWEATR